MMVRDKKLDLAVRVSTEPLLLNQVATSLPVGSNTTFNLLSIPFYLISELQRLVAEVPLDTAPHTKGP